MFKNLVDLHEFDGADINARRGPREDRLPLRPGVRMRHSIVKGTAAYCLKKGKQNNIDTCKKINQVGIAYW